MNPMTLTDMKLEKERARKRDYMRAKRAANPDWGRAERQKYVEKNRTKINAAARASQARRRAADPQWAKERHFLRNYGITIAQRDELLVKQGNCCAICKTENPIRQWRIDHCHKTNVVRGILCSNCNVGIGMLGEDPERIRAAAVYVEASS